MGVLSMVAKGRQIACHDDWPLFYMNDFSRMGLVVNGLPEMARALEINGYQFRQDDQGLAVEISSQEQLVKIITMLQEHQIEYEMTDLVRCVYQG
ncbi:hypothetical protein [Desulfobulbus alkaliphilus]|uniref:hypothetical protein n=1 Tax=Desulfobulbus alkaliphilus TaxID=869814 RepID=UPI0019644C6E|nr:hypothetical protein [Desulfobulbus alkaliphilus]MBM9538236.1 hypothetical protein [Desulfobulbus alkaliphilus]